MAFLLDKPEPGDFGRRGPKRLWTVYPVPVISWAWWEGYELLQEPDAADLLALYHAFRDALLWASTDPMERDGLFDPARCYEIEPGHPAAEPLSVLFNITSESARGDEARAATACEAISAWAGTVGMDAVEYLFAYLAARVSPGSHERAFAAGRAARRQGRFRDAEAFFRRTIALSRRVGDDAGYANGYIGWAIMEEKRGNLVYARRRFVSAWRAAKRGGLPELGAATRHNMIALALAERNFDEGQRHIASAYRLYGRKNQQLFRLANDAGGFWSTFGYYSVALPLFEAALPSVTRPVERAAILANICRAAAGLSKKDQYLEAWTECTKLDRDMGDSMPDIYMELCRGAQTLGYRKQARELAIRAIASSEARRYEGKAAMARELLAAVQAGEHREDAVDPPAELEAFAARFLKALREMRPR